MNTIAFVAVLLASVMHDNQSNICQGVIALRAANRVLVQGNVFDGRSKPNTGGITLEGSRSVSSTICKAISTSEPTFSNNTRRSSPSCAGGLRKSFSRAAAGHWTSQSQTGVTIFRIRDSNGR